MPVATLSATMSTMLPMPVTAALPAGIPSPSSAVWYLGPIPVRAYALCILAGVFVAVWWSDRRYPGQGRPTGSGPRRRHRGRPGWNRGRSSLPCGLLARRLLRSQRRPVPYSADMAGGPGNLGRHRRWSPGRDASPASSWPACCSAGRRRRPDAVGRSGDRSTGKLVQPGALRRSDDTALGAADR